MIYRLVKMTFKPDKVETFEALFNRQKDSIRSFPGCEHVRLMHDLADTRVFFTFSIWQNEQALEAYRSSELFEQTWAETKILFDDRPQAWSTSVVAEGTQL